MELGGGGWAGVPLPGLGALLRGVEASVGVAGFGAAVSPAALAGSAGFVSAWASFGGDRLTGAGYAIPT